MEVFTYFFFFIYLIVHPPREHSSSYNMVQRDQKVGPYIEFPYIEFKENKRTTCGPLGTLMKASIHRLENLFKCSLDSSYGQ